jgi:cytochrome c554/c'-like protein
MRGAITGWAARGLAGAVLGTLMVAVPNAPSAQTQTGDAPHLGVASCAGSTCHGAVERLKGSSVAQNEYITWSRQDKHAKAYAVLLEPRSVRIARNLGLPSAHTAPLCLDCHADNPPPEKRGRTFQISDGVGCEACHGGARDWLGVHISGASHRENLAAGLYPTDEPLKRAEKCLSCHFGDEKRFVTHRIMGAGHPRMSFELDTFTAVQPAHFVIDKAYVERKGAVSGVQVWAVGQAVGLVKFIDTLLDPKHAPNGMFPELVLFDCQACHHGLSQIRWEPRKSTGLPPGTPRLYDANAVMLRVIVARVAPAAAKSLGDHMLALHRATTEGWANVQREARELRPVASGLIPQLLSHDFTREEMRALVEELIALGLTREDVDYASAEQTTMGLSSILTAMKLAGALNDPQSKTINDAMKSVYETVGNNETYRPDSFVDALKSFQKALPPR